MKALSIRQPHLNRILEGKKKWEYRSWQTTYRGDILLCSAKKPDTGFSYDDFEFCDLGTAICIAEITEIKMIKNKLLDSYKDHEFIYAWRLENIRETKRIRVKGKLSLFDVPLVKNDILKTRR